jgi:superfamily II DNA or RNA helicase
MKKYLEKHLAEYFDSGVRGRGEAYKRTGAVRLKRGDAWEVQAQVRGGDRYEVTLERNEGEIVASCECPYFADRGPCKHLWAVILTADVYGYLSGDGAQRPVTLTFDEPEYEPDDYFDYDDEDEEEDEDEAEAPSSIPAVFRGAINTLKSVITGGNQRASPNAHPPAPAKPEMPSWKEQLAALGATPREVSVPSPREEWPATREVLYVLDVPATLNGHNFIVEIFYRDRRKDGSWGTAKTKRLARSALANITNPQDRQVFALLVGAKEQYAQYSYYQNYNYSYYDSYDQLPTCLRLTDPLPEMALPLIAQSGRCRLRLRPEAGEAHWLPVAWDEAGTWEFRLEVAPVPEGWELKGILRRGEQQLDLKEPLLLHQSGFVVTRTQIARLDDRGAFQWILFLRKNERVVIPFEQRDELLQELLRYPELPPLDLPTDFKYEEIKLTPRPLLTIKKPEPNPYGYQPERLRGKLAFDYDGVVIQSDEARRGIYQAEVKRFLVRDQPFEQAAATLLHELGFRYKPKDYLHKEAGWDLAPSKLPRAVRVLIGAGWHVEAEGKVFHTPGEMKIEVSSGIDWFELHGTVDFGGSSAKLPVLLAALQRGDNLVKLDDGTFGLLPEQWLNKFGLLAGLGQAQDDHLRFTKSQIGVLDALLLAQPKATYDAVFAQARDRLKQFNGIEPADPTPEFKGELRPYQREGLGWLHFLREFNFGGCLADDMGLGKTVQVLALLEARRALKEGGSGSVRERESSGVPAPAPPLPHSPHPSLIVVPKSLVFNWKQEAARFAPKLRILDHTGQGRKKDGENFAEYDVILTTYGTLRNDAVTFKDLQFDYVILDEAQAVKNADTASAKAVRLLRGNHKLALSGTPVENHLGELWSMFEFLNPGMLGAASVFKLTGAGARNPDEETRKLLAHALRPFILRRTKEQVAKELPQKLEQTLFCELEPKQRKLYNELREHYRNNLLNRLDTAGLKKAKIQILEALLRLRQAACHPGLIDKKRAEESSAKLDLLMTHLTAVLDEGRKVLVFSQFTSLLAIVKGFLDKEGLSYEYLDGKTKDRQAIVEKFQTDPDSKLFLISLKAGGLGLNLTAAEYVYLLDPWWNPAVEAQAIDRAHRIGQVNQVFAYRLIARDTVEEKVLELQKTKRDLADAIINADNSLIRNLGREDLELLLS